jgi:hypothetical protein
MWNLQNRLMQFLTAALPNCCAPLAQLLAQFGRALPLVAISEFIAVFINNGTLSLKKSKDDIVQKRKKVN